MRAFEEKYNSLSIDQVWLIHKSRSEEGFQKWHQEVPNLEGDRAILKTIAVNIGQMTAKLPEDEVSLSNEEVLLEYNQPSTPEVKVGSPEEKSPEVQIVGYRHYNAEKQAQQTQDLAAKLAAAETSNRKIASMLAQTDIVKNSLVDPTGVEVRINEEVDLFFNELQSLTSD